jgi:hypothetical protein
MEQHPVSFDELADWVDERLEEDARQRIEAHLESGCAQCATDVAWLRHLKQVSRAEALPDPPQAVVARAKRLCMPQPIVAESMWAWLAQLWRSPMRLASAALLLVLVVTALHWPILVISEPVQGMSEALIAEAALVESEEQQAASPSVRVNPGIPLRTVTEPADLTLFDGSSVEMQPGAQITLGSIRKNVMGSSYRIVIEQGSGSVHYSVARLEGVGSAFEVRTPGALVSVQGTTFVVTVTDEGQTRVVVAEGRVRVRGNREDWLLLPREYVAVSPTGLLSETGILSVDEMGAFGLGLVKDDATQEEPYPGVQAEGTDAVDGVHAPSSTPQRPADAAPALLASPRPSHTATALPQPSVTRPISPDIPTEGIVWPPIPTLELPELPDVTITHELWPTISWPWTPGEPLPPKPILTMTLVMPTWPATPQPPGPLPTYSIPAPMPPKPADGPFVPLPTLPAIPALPVPPTAWPSVEIPAPPAYTPVPPPAAPTVPTAPPEAGIMPPEAPVGVPTLSVNLGELAKTVVPILTRLAAPAPMPRPPRPGN